MSTDSIREWTQAILAIGIVFGGGLILYLQPTSQAVPFITGTIGGVVGWYFSRASVTTGANTVLRAQEAPR